MAQITVYTTEPCSFCARVKQLLAQRGVVYEEINLSKDPEGRAELVERTGMLSFPQVVIGDEVLGGFRETLEADRSGRLRELLAAWPPLVRRRLLLDRRHARGVALLDVVDDRRLVVLLLVWLAHQ